MTEKYLVSYKLEYWHSVMVGVTANSEQHACVVAQLAFDNGVLWENSEEMPLLLDLFEEQDGNTLNFHAQRCRGEYPIPDSSVRQSRLDAHSFEVWQQLIAVALLARQTINAASEDIYRHAEASREPVERLRKAVAQWHIVIDRIQKLHTAIEGSAIDMHRRGRD